MKVEVSIGEAIDKLNILEIKLAKISDADKLADIQVEINALSECAQYRNAYQLYYNILTYINDKIWTMTDTVKTLTVDDPSFASISYKIFEFNQKRFRIKKWFNMLTSSNIKEHKSYAESHCQIHVENEQHFFDKLPEIYFLATEYDAITLNADFNISNLVGVSIPPTIITNASSVISENSSPPTIIDLREFAIPPEIERNVFDSPPIYYLVGGMFGDFIQSLSVICELYHMTGRKGILYISEHPQDPFRRGLENTYKDTYSVIMSQPYIQDYKLFNRDPVNINLSEWRLNPQLYVQNWYHTFSQTYRVEWGKHKWLTSEYDEKWADKVVISVVSYRFPVNIDFQLLKTQYPNELVFIASDRADHVFFENATNIAIPYHEVSSFTELTTIINSCKLFVGALSGHLTIAHAIHKQRICGLSGDHGKDVMNIGLEPHLPNIRYSV